MVYIDFTIQLFSSYLFFNFPYQFKAKDIPNIASGSLMVISSEALLTIQLILDINNKFTISYDFTSLTCFPLAWSVWLVSLSDLSYQLLVPLQRINELFSTCTKITHQWSNLINLENYLYFLLFLFIYSAYLRSWGTLQKVWIKPLKVTNLGVAQALFNP